MPFEVHREPLYRRYYATYFSGACCYAIIFGFLLVFLPIIITYNSDDFWIKEKIYYEQPVVAYKYQVLTQVFGSSTSPTINQLHNKNLRMSIVQSAELDDNRDGIVDRLELNIQIPLSYKEQINGVNILLSHSVSLSSRVRYVFDSVSFVNYESATPISNLFVEGDLLLRQTFPLSSKGGYSAPYENDDLIPLRQYMSAEDVSFRNILQKASSRSLGLFFKPTYSYAEKQSLFGASGNSVAIDKSSPRILNLTLAIRIPTQPVRYTPPVSDLLKWAWVQYMSIFIVVAFLLFRLNSFIFRHQLVDSYVLADVIAEKLE